MLLEAKSRVASSLLDPCRCYEAEPREETQPGCASSVPGAVVRPQITVSSPRDFQGPKSRSGAGKNSAGGKIPDRSHGPVRFGAPKEGCGQSRSD